MKYKHITLEQIDRAYQMLNAIKTSMENGRGADPKEVYRMICDAIPELERAMENLERESDTFDQHRHLNGVNRN